MLWGILHTTEIPPPAISFRARPILKLPDRRSTTGIPSGWTDVLIDETRHEANFVRAFVNVVRRRESDLNVLPDILRGWFGPDAGLPGTKFEVCFDQTENGYRMAIT